MNFDGLVVASSLDFWGRYGLLYFVEIFFAMSGFFLSASIDRISEEQPEGTLSFLKRRALRIYPIYWVAIVSAVLIYVVIQGAYTSNSNYIKVFLLPPLSDVPYVFKDRVDSVNRDCAFDFCGRVCFAKAKTVLSGSNGGVGMCYPGNDCGWQINFRDITDDAGNILLWKRIITDFRLSCLLFVCQNCKEDTF